MAERHVRIENLVKLQLRRWGWATYVSKKAFSALQSFDLSKPRREDKESGSRSAGFESIR